MLIQKIKITLLLFVFALTVTAQNNTYKGIIPCADCEGIIYILSLNQGGFYKEVMIYKGKNAMPLTAAGNYTIKNGFVTLDKPSDGMKYFKQAGNDLLMLDASGQEITGTLASRYLLENEVPDSGNKNSPQTAPFTANRENIKLQTGIDFYAFGNEPSWSLAIDFEKNMHFKNIDGGDIVTATGKGEKAMDANVVRYASKNTTSYLSVQIMQQGCTDNMSGEKFDYKVMVDTKNISEKTEQHFEGCGNYVADKNLNGLWFIKSINGTAVTNAKQFMKGMPTLEIKTSEKTFGGTSGCNSFNGKIFTEGAAIRFSSMAATEMYCNDNGFEQNYFKALQSITKYNIKNGELILSNPDKTTLIFTKNEMKAAADKTTETTNGGMKRLNDIWVLESMTDVKVNAENYMKGLPQLEFRIADMHYMGTTGCNSLNGKFEADDKKIKILPGAMTRMYCEGAHEGDFLKLLNAATTYSITDNRLSLKENGKVVLVFRKAD
jgi:heat shock protein HslJ/uncharacterized lipoprotein NlpE involved in copper resistance